MSGRNSAATERALKLVLKHGYSIVEAAKRAGVAITTVRRALKRVGPGDKR